MARRFGSFDESDVRVRPGKGSRPRTKDRPKHKNAKFGMVITKDRGRWGVALDDGPRVTAMRARELGRTAIEDCPRGCTHMGPPADPECGLDDPALISPDTASARRRDAVRGLLEALRTNVEWEN